MNEWNVSLASAHRQARRVEPTVNSVPFREVTSIQPLLQSLHGTNYFGGGVTGSSLLGGTLEDFGWFPNGPEHF
jgi:hypothetical protein